MGLGRSDKAAIIIAVCFLCLLLTATLVFDDGFRQVSSAADGLSPNISALSRGDGVSSGAVAPDQSSTVLSRGYINPAAAYCSKMGYQYEVRVDGAGNEYGVCVFPDGSEGDAWDFLRGECGQDFSYCAKYGYGTETETVTNGSYVSECAVCTAKQAINESVASLASVERIPMLELMERNGEPLYTAPEVEEGGNDLESLMCETQSISSQVKSLPASFDWRNYGGHSYIGAVRDQGDCGSCYAFAAAASAEGVYNWAAGKYDGNCADFSESFIVWCLGRVYSSHLFFCDGADYSYTELTGLTAYGICSEASFPYRVTDPGSCTHWSDPVVKFSSWGRVPCGDINAIKTAIMTYGVVDAAVYADSNFQAYGGGIYRDS